MQLKKLTYGALTAAVLYGVASVSASAATISFDQTNASSPAGSLSYDGEGGALIGSGISFDRVSLNDGTVPAGNENTLTCSACTLNFATGANTLAGPGIWNFAAGGELTISGSAIDSTGNVIASGSLVNGTFTDEGFQSQSVLRSGQSTLLANTFGSDDKNEDLASYFGLDVNEDFMFANSEISLGEAAFGDDGSFVANVTGADFNNTAPANTIPPATDVPEPQELGLFALGVALLLGGLGFRRGLGSRLG